MTNNNATLQLVEILRAAPSAPFLFIGSGFSKRYLGADDWPTLLRRFCSGIQPFEFYLSSADGNLPLVAQMMAEDFHQLVWSDPSYSEFIQRNQNKFKNKSSALRVAIASHLLLLSQKGFENTEYRAEIELLSGLAVDGIITTNWDTFLEDLFPDYKVYVGQEDLLFSNPQSIAEIYKIHGCSRKSSSLVLTADDYALFEQRNAYLAAKIITIFVEHPVVFLGYSLTDKNIGNLLKSIVECLGQDRVMELRKNLIFVDWKKGASSSVTESIMALDGFQLPVTIVRTDSFIPIYAALGEVKRKIPARILRYCKEQLYELVRSSNPDGKISVVDMDRIEKRDDVQFVVGLGVADAEEAKIAERGYIGLRRSDIYKDIVFNGSTLDSHELLEKAYPELIKGCTWLPIYKYLTDVGINTLNELAHSRYSHINAKYDSSIYPVKQYWRSYLKNAKGFNASEISTRFPAEKACIFLSFLKAEHMDMGALEKFIKDNFERLINLNGYSSYFRRLICYYDYLKYGREMGEVGI